MNCGVGPDGLLAAVEQAMFDWMAAKGWMKTFSMLHIFKKVQNINFLGDVNWARGSVIFDNIWRGVPFVAITLLAGLQTVQPSLYEAAMLDGATAWQRFRHVTLPMLKPILLYVLVTSTINAYNVFTLRAIVDHYPIRSAWLTLQPRNSIRQIDGVWTTLTWKAAGRAPRDVCNRQRRALR